MLRVGDTAPDFVATDHLGRSVALKDLRGKTVVLWFYPKADTPGCTAEGCSFRDLSADYATKDAVIYGVSFDPPEENKAFAEKFNFTFPLLCDTDRKLGMAYGACDNPEATHADRIGVVIDPSGRIRVYEPKVDARTWPAELFTQL